MFDHWCMLPYHLARHNEHRYADRLGALNLFLGWTVFGWAISFMLALDRPLVIHRTPEKAVIGESSQV